MNRLWAAVIFWTLFAAPAGALAEELMGTVLGNDGSPEVNVQVRFEGIASYLSVTNSQGNFYVLDLPSGPYKVTVVSGRNFQVFTVTVGQTLSPETLMVNW